MTGRATVHQLRQRLKGAFERADQLPVDSLELRSDFARYLCVLLSGYVELALAALTVEHARKNGGPSLVRFVDVKTRRFANANAQRITELLGSFSTDWRTTLESFVVDERKAALDSLVSLRNRIAHGQSVDLTLSRVRDYFTEIQRVVEMVADLCDPP